MVHRSVKSRAVHDPRGVALAGVVTIGVSYGFARYGYGLFEPALRTQFQLSVAASGAVAASGYVGYVAGLLIVGVLVDRVGPRVLVAAAGAAAALGLGAMAVATGPVSLVVGVIVAGASSGLAWSPYSEVVHRTVPTLARGRVLAAIASGTAFGVSVAGGAALVAGTDRWRPVWWAFCALGVVSVVLNLVIVPRTRTVVDDRVGSPIEPVRRLLATSSARPLFVSAFCYGVIGAVYWTFSVASISSAMPGVAGPIFWTAVGLSGTTAIAAGRLFARIGLRRSHLLLFSSLGVAALAVAVAPGSPWAVGASAVLYGPAFMATSGLLAVWSYEVFPERPSVGFTVTVLALGIGSILGPLLLGVVAEVSGLDIALLVTAALGAVALAARPASTASR